MNTREGLPNTNNVSVNSLTQFIPFIELIQLSIQHLWVMISDLLWEFYFDVHYFKLDWTYKTNVRLPIPPKRYEDDPCSSAK